jgi:hypothetical protein
VPGLRIRSSCRWRFSCTSAVVGASVLGPTPPARSQPRLPTLPGPAAGARRPSARPRRRPG